MTADFRDIPGYQDSYAINRRGDVLSLERVVNGPNGRPKHVRQRVLRQHHRDNGSALVQLSRHGCRSTYYVEKLLAETSGDVRQQH